MKIMNFRGKLLLNKKSKWLVKRKSQLNVKKVRHTSVKSVLMPKDGHCFELGKYGKPPDEHMKDK